ncbi:MAG TPA: hypothetical protein PKE55_03100 [Kiritimatiellia bacterium]|nr:hypothetical protein [Kiritimatiellia bacterium]
MRRVEDAALMRLVVGTKQKGNRVNKRDLIVVWTAVTAYTVISLCSMWEDMQDWGFFSALARSLFVTVPLAVFFAVVATLLIATLRWRDRNRATSSARPKRAISWQRGLFRVYLLWPLPALGIVFLFDEWYEWSDLVVQTAIVAAIPWVLHFPVKWSFRWILLPIFHWLIHGFFPRCNDDEPGDSEREIGGT